MTEEQGNTLIQQMLVASQYSQEVAFSAAQMNAAAQVQVHATMYLLGAVLLLGLLIAALLRPRNRGV